MTKMLIFCSFSFFTQSPFGARGWRTVLRVFLCALSVMANNRHTRIILYKYI